MNFGKEENIHYDSLPQLRKDQINEFSYKAEEGEGWVDVRNRAITFFSELDKNGNYLIFAHGGLICSLTWHIGIQDILPNASAVGIELDQITDVPKRIHFKWIYPQVEEL